MSSVFTLKEGNINKGYWGLYDVQNQYWILDPIYSYTHINKLSIIELQKEIFRLTRKAAKKAINSKKIKNSLMADYNESIDFIQQSFNTPMIKHACENYCDDLCKCSTNLRCIKCEFRYNNFLKIIEKGDNNE